MLATALGTLAAVGLTGAHFPGKGVLMSILISPMVVPVVIVGVGAYLFMAPMGLTGNYLGLIMVHAALGVPFVVITVSATLRGFNVNLMKASASLGAPPLMKFLSRQKRVGALVGEGCELQWFSSCSASEYSWATTLD